MNEVYLAAGFWIDPKERQPFTMGKYLIEREDGEIEIEFWSGSRWVSGKRVKAWAHISNTEGKGWK